MKFIDEAAQALSRILFIPSAHARSIAESLDDETRENLHAVAEGAAADLRALVDAHEARQQETVA